MKKALVQIDGSNFYRGVKRLLPNLHLTTFKYLELAKSIVKTTKIHVTYYVGEIRQFENNRKSQILFSNQQKLFTNLRNQKIEVKLGYLLLSDGKFHEKGVDVQIAVDMVRGAIKKEYDTCYLLSSDTDLLPAIQTARNEGKKIIYAGFENFMSRALIKNCSSYLILKQKDLQPFVKKKK